MELNPADPFAQPDIHRSNESNKGISEPSKPEELHLIHKLKLHKKILRKAYMYSIYCSPTCKSTSEDITIPLCHVLRQLVQNFTPHQALSHGVAYQSITCTIQVEWWHSEGVVESCSVVAAIDVGSILRLKGDWCTHSHAVQHLVYYRSQSPLLLPPFLQHPLILIP